MSFFKKYNGTTNRRLARMETVIWVLIYGGLLTLLIGLYMSRQQSGSGMELVVAGSLVTACGALLVVVRSRMREKD